MNNDKEIWSAVTSRIAGILPGCEVVRTYDPEKSLGALEELGKTLVLVCIAGKVSEMVSKTTSRDDYEYRIFAVDYISASTASAEEAEMDAMLEIPTKIYDAFALQNMTVTVTPPPDPEPVEPTETLDTVETAPATTEGTPETIVVKLLAGDNFEVEFLTTYETFIACITLRVTAIRDIVPPTTEN